VIESRANAARQIAWLADLATELDRVLPAGLNAWP
jgi:hypothetical protein